MPPDHPESLKSPRSIALRAAEVTSAAGKSRGALSHLAGRYETVEREEYDDGWAREEEPPSPLKTFVTEERARSIIQHNDSPDLPFTQSINPYRGCEHGCSYCYARPSHSYLDLSPGLDFESKLFAKVNAAELLRTELGKRGHKPSAISIGANTDAYQPIERRYRITRSIIEVLSDCDHPFTVVTKSALVERDLDLIAPMARKNLVKIFVTITTLDRTLARRLEPRAASPQRRLDTVRALAEAGVPVGVMVAPIIPGLNDKSIEEVIEAAAAAGARGVAYTIVRLAHELKPLFREWLEAHVPLRAAHVMSLLRDMRGGKDNDPRFGLRMTGMGNYAELIARRFEIARRRAGLDREARGGTNAPLDCTLFRPPAQAADSLQMGLF